MPDRDEMIDRLYRAHMAAAASIAEFGVPDGEREDAVERAWGAVLDLGPDPECAPATREAPDEDPPRDMGLAERIRRRRERATTREAAPPHVEDVWGEPVQGGRWFKHSHGPDIDCDYDCGGAWVAAPSPTTPAPREQDRDHCWKCGLTVFASDFAPDEPVICLECAAPALDATTTKRKEKES